MCGLSPSKPIPIIPTNAFLLPIAPAPHFLLTRGGRPQSLLHEWLRPFVLQVEAFPEGLVSLACEPSLRGWALPQVSFCHCVEHS